MATDDTLRLHGLPGDPAPLPACSPVLYTSGVRASPAHLDTGFSDGLCACVLSSFRKRPSPREPCCADMDVECETRQGYKAKAAQHIHWIRKKFRRVSKQDRSILQNLVGECSPPLSSTSKPYANQTLWITQLDVPDTAHTQTPKTCEVDFCILAGCDYLTTIGKVSRHEHASAGSRTRFVPPHTTGYADTQSLLPPRKLRFADLLTRQRGSPSKLF